MSYCKTYSILYFQFSHFKDSKAYSLELSLSGVRTAEHPIQVSTYLVFMIPRVTYPFSLPQVSHFYFSRLKNNNNTVPEDSWLKRNSC